VSTYILFALAVAVGVGLLFGGVYIAITTLLIDSPWFRVSKREVWFMHFVAALLLVLGVGALITAGGVLQ
jgi:hypothetical protein